MNEVDVINNGYVPTEDGHIYSLKSHKILSEQHSKDGYKRIVASINGIVSTHLVHRLVATAFIPNPKNLPCINHKDENRGNNRVDNLEWCDYLYNNNYGDRKYKYAKSRSKNLNKRCGVGFHKRDGKWYANIRVDGELIHLGYFKEKEDAIKARENAELKYYGKYC